MLAARTTTTTTMAALLAMAAAAGPAMAWHGHRHRGYHRYLTIGRAGPAALPGYHCPLGQWWRPSLGICQGIPYGSGRIAAEPPARAEPPPAVPPAPEVPPVQSAGSGRRVVNTDTKVVGRRRQVTKDGVLVTYEVRTRVTERYPNR